MKGLEPFALAVLAFWVALALDRSRAWPAEMRLRETGLATGPPSQRVVAIVPARNEAAMLVRTLPALLDQEELTALVLVDDDSDDSTAETARRMAAEAGRSDRVRVISAGAPPPGWAGKVSALAAGIATPQAGAADWLLLTDADIEHRPGSVRSLLEQAGEGYDLVSVMARLRTESLWERLLIPTFVYFFQLLYPFRRVADPRSGVAAAAGGCVLVRRELLRRAGGLDAIAGAVIDDVALGKRIAAAGGRLWLGLDRGIRSLRPYPRLGEVWRMVSRSAFDQLDYRLGLLVLVLAGLGLFFVAPPLGLAAGFAAGLAGEPAGWRVALWSALSVMLQVRSLAPTVRHHGIGATWAAVLPLASLLFAAMTLSSAWAHWSGAGARWRGREIGRGPRPG